MKVKVSADVSKPVESWSSKDFIVYYSNKLQFLTGKPLPIEGPAWQGFASRIKGFRNKTQITNKQYKQFIDDVFEKFFTRKGYAPAFGAITSEKVFCIVQKLHRTKSSSVSNAEFLTLRDELYGNNILFSKFI